MREPFVGFAEGLQMVGVVRFFKSKSRGVMQNVIRIGAAWKRAGAVGPCKRMILDFCRNVAVFCF